MVAWRTMEGRSQDTHRRDCYDAGETQDDPEGIGRAAQILLTGLIGLAHPA